MPAFRRREARCPPSECRGSPSAPKARACPPAAGPSPKATALRPAATRRRNRRAAQASVPTGIGSNRRRSPARSAPRCSSARRSAGLTAHLVAAGGTDPFRMSSERILVRFLRAAEYALSLSLSPLGSPLLCDCLGLLARALAVCLVRHLPVSPSFADSERLDQHRDPLPAADTGSPDTIACAAALELVKQVHGDAGPRRSERMADCNCPAIHIRLVARQPKLLFHREVLGRKRLVDLDQIRILNTHPRALQQLADGGCRANSHDAGLDAGGRPVHQPPNRRNSPLLCPASRGHHRRARAIADSRSGTRVHHAVLLENLRELLQSFQRRIRPI